MKRTPVTSSQVESIGYDESTKKLQVEFKPFKKDAPNAVYEYSNVPKELHNAIFAAESIGHEINARLKSNPTAYPHRRLSKEEAAK